MQDQEYVQNQINDYIASLPQAKQTEMLELKDLMLAIMPETQLWFLDGKNEVGKVVSNPNIGFGKLQMDYADGSSKAFYQIGLSANTSGISVYIMGLEDKKYLQETFGDKIGKASVTGYCIKFKKLKDIDLEVLKNAVRSSVALTSA